MNLRATGHWCGIAGAAFFVAGVWIERMCLAHGASLQPRIYGGTCYQVGLVLGLAAMAGAIVAVRHGSPWWMALVLISGWFSLTSFMGEL